MFLAKVLTYKGKRKDEYLYVTDRNGTPRQFASKSELRRAAFQQFGDDLNVVTEEVYGTQGEAGNDQRHERKGQEEASDGGLAPSQDS